MGRLIDEDVLMQDINNTITEQSSILDWLNLINRQPTAYDVDTVVKQLENRYGKINKCTLDYTEGLKDAYEKSIEIVKGGGK